MSSFPLFSASQPNPRRSYVSMQPILAPPVRPHFFTSTSQGASSGRRRSAGYSPPRSSTSSSPSSSSKRNEALWDEAIEKRAFNEQLTPPKSADEHEAPTLKLVFANLDGDKEEIKTLDLVHGAMPLGLGRRGTGQPASLTDGTIGCPVMSKEHAEVFNKHGKIFITDVGSMHGTSVNAVKLRGITPHELRNGDRVVFGKDVDKRGNLHPALRLSVSISQTPSSLSNSSSSPVVACHLFARPLPSLSSGSSRARSPHPERSKSPPSLIQSTLPFVNASVAAPIPVFNFRSHSPVFPVRSESPSFCPSPPGMFGRWGYTTEDEEADASAVEEPASPAFPRASFAWTASEEVQEIAVSEPLVEAGSSSSQQVSRPREASSSPDLESIDGYASQLLGGPISMIRPSPPSSLQALTMGGGLAAYMATRRGLSKSTGGRTIPVPADDEDIEDIDQDEIEGPEEFEIEFGGRRKKVDEGRWSHHDDDEMEDEPIVDEVIPTSFDDFDFENSEHESASSSSRKNPVLRRRAKLQKRASSHEIVPAIKYLPSGKADLSRPSDFLNKFNNLPKVSTKTSTVMDDSDSDIETSNADDDDSEGSVASGSARLLLDPEVAESEENDEESEAEPTGRESRYIDIEAEEGEASDEVDEMEEEEEESWEEEDEFDPAPAQVVEDSDDGLSNDDSDGEEDKIVKVTEYMEIDSSDEEVVEKPSSPVGDVADEETSAEVTVVLVGDSDGEVDGEVDAPSVKMKGVVEQEAPKNETEVDFLGEVEPVHASVILPRSVAPAASVETQLATKLKDFTKKVETLESTLDKTTTLIESTLGKRKRLDDDDSSLLASSSTQTLSTPSQTQISVQSTNTEPILTVADNVKATAAFAVQGTLPARKKSRVGSFLLGALTGSVATLGALAAYGWNEEGL